MRKENIYGFRFLSENIEIDYSWKQIFEELEPELSRIEKQIVSDDISSDTCLIFKVFKKSINDIDTIILGQDPYPQKGTPTGIAFESKDYTDWNKTTGNTSLNNILKAIYNQKNGFPKKILEIRKSIKDGTFKILPPDKIFKKLENEGVFLINTSLTCKVDDSNSHKLIWSCFSKRIIEKISTNQNIKKWLLWGVEARNYTNLINSNGKHNSVYKYPHPATNKFVESGAVEYIINKLYP